MKREGAKSVESITACQVRVRSLAKWLIALVLAGQEQVKSKDGTHTVTIGSADDKKHGATAFVSQQDKKGTKLTTVYDKRGNVVKEVERKAKSK